MQMKEAERVDGLRWKRRRGRETRDVMRRRKREREAGRGEKGKGKEKFFTLFLESPDLRQTEIN